MPAQFRTQKTDDRSQKRKQGFTLIELMIAISIVAIISAIGITSYSQAQKLARDSKRKQDLRSIALALELYFQKNKHYPCTSMANGGFISSPATAGNWITSDTSLNSTCAAGGNLDSNYINSTPIDPLKNTNAAPYSGDDTLGYGYFSTDQCSKPAGQFYALVAGLENVKDPDANGNKSSAWCDGSTLDHWGKNKFIITSQ